MKTLALLMLLPMVAVACPKGEHEDSGACAYNTSATPDDSAKWVSDERPPKTTTGEWQTGKVKIIDLRPQSIDDEITSKKAEDAKMGINDK